MNVSNNHYSFKKEKKKKNSDLNSNVVTNSLRVVTMNNPCNLVMWSIVNTARV